MLFKKWTEFVVYPLDSTRVSSLAQRLDTEKAFRMGAGGQYPPEMSKAQPSERAAVIPLSMIVTGDDSFECMEITDAGQVCIWTHQKVWFLTLEGIDRRVEKLRYVPRHPPPENKNAGR